MCDIDYFKGDKHYLHGHGVGVISQGNSKYNKECRPGPSILLSGSAEGFLAILVGIKENDAFVARE